MAFKEEFCEKLEGLIEATPSKYKERVGKLLEALPDIGTAYGFFYCNAPKTEVEAYLPKSREDASTPNSLELALEEGINPEKFNYDPELKKLAYQAKNMGNNYAMIAILPHATITKRRLTN